MATSGRMTKEARAANRTAGGPDRLYQRIARILFEVLVGSGAYVRRLPGTEDRPEFHVTGFELTEATRATRWLPPASNSAVRPN